MSDHLMDIATQQLVTIARTTAYHCDEQHEYMKGAGGNDWLPHKWVIEAMRAAVTIRNTQAEDMVREELHQARAQLAEAHALLRDIELTMDAQEDSVSLGYDIGLRMANMLRPSARAEPSAPAAKCTNEDSWNCKYCRNTESCEALKDPRNFGEPSAPAERDERDVLLDKAQELIRQGVYIEDSDWFDLSNQISKLRRIDDAEENV